jgi:myosin heavy subunit
LGVNYGIAHQHGYCRRKYTDRYPVQAQTKRAGRKKDAGGAAPRGQPQSQFAAKAVFETTKKKEVGVSDLTLISKVSNEAINENLKKRFENGEIYVRRPACAHPAPHSHPQTDSDSD